MSDQRDDELRRLTPIARGTLQHDLAFDVKNKISGALNAGNVNAWDLAVDILEMVDRFVHGEEPPQGAEPNEAPQGGTAEPEAPSPAELRADANEAELRAVERSLRDLVEGWTASSAKWAARSNAEGDTEALRWLGWSEGLEHAVLGLCRELGIERPGAPTSSPTRVAPGQRWRRRATGEVWRVDSVRVDSVRAFNGVMWEVFPIWGFLAGDAWELVPWDASAPPVEKASPAEPCAPVLLTEQANARDNGVYCARHGGRRLSECEPAPPDAEPAPHVKEVLPTPPMANTAPRSGWWAMALPRRHQLLRWLGRQNPQLGLSHADALDAMDYALRGLRFGVKGPVQSDASRLAFIAWLEAQLPTVDGEELSPGLVNSACDLLRGASPGGDATHPNAGQGALGGGDRIILARPHVGGVRGGREDRARHHRRHDAPRPDRQHLELRRQHRCEASRDPARRLTAAAAHAHVCAWQSITRGAARGTSTYPRGSTESCRTLRS